LSVKQCFSDDKEIVNLATKIYDRVDFKWMLDGHPHLLSHGWRPETGFIKTRWDTYSEHALLYFLAIGSPTFPISPQSWNAWKRSYITYGAYKYLAEIRRFLYINFRKRGSICADDAKSAHRTLIITKIPSKRRALRDNFLLTYQGISDILCKHLGFDGF
jgi:hypothetical protein